VSDEIFERTHILSKRTSLRVQVIDGVSVMELETYSRDYDQDAKAFPMTADYDGAGYQVFPLTKDDVNELAQLFSLAFVSVIEQEAEQHAKKSPRLRDPSPPPFSFDTTEPKADVI
jgi:outer membrane scaffolding protein for murein synthesis (MipA/OmpV family)